MISSSEDASLIVVISVILLTVTESITSNFVILTCVYILTPSCYNEAVICVYNEAVICSDRKSAACGYYKGRPYT